MADLTAKRLAKHLEELQSASGPLATYLAKLHRSFQDAGFTREESLTLIIEMERAMVTELTKPVRVLVQPTMKFEMGGPEGL